MPLWRIFHPEGTFDNVSERQALTKEITRIYVKGGLPAFYVVVVFLKVDKEAMFRGGQVQPSDTKPPFVRLVFDHIARNFEPGRSARKLQFFDKVNAVMKTHLEERGMEWEIHGENTDITMNRIQGLEMPPEDSSVFAQWVAEERPVAYEWQPGWKRD